MNNIKKAWLIPMYFFGVMGFFLIFALLWTAPIQFGLIQSGYTAVSQAPDVSGLWSVSNIPVFIVTIACSIGIAFDYLTSESQ
ncbi:MAG: hypothetical protein V3U87_16885 [Methylococcaceae bacterium]